MTNETSTPVVITPLSASEEHTWAMLSHLSVLVNLFTGFLGPIVALIIYLLFKDRSRYVAYHSLQAFINQLVWWVGGGTIIGIAWAITGTLIFALVGICLLPLACLVSLMPIISVVQGVWGAVKTANGEDFRYWWIGDWTRSTLER
ncbi:MAG: DUF4870 domain-containing protein [Anaerolineae bacterium CG_4_9_14_3_um_filter_57_17]|nr:DUF4870 domain-containing protein [bacterium]NCT21295.1 DUF4870 domain-containing protein [bacterium]OIO84849.1 MAG: hypothetical protein AUK01_08535 [Anaerolineae bacterium CG2_30_57_67]PJB66421.1 MAG: DUF4870 domain-containing protein [Anaerolineae bacterium CG_4_9_14_3_um_filter_57_17]